MSISVWKAVTNPLNYSYVDRDRVDSGGRCLEILEEVKITHFEPVYVQSIKLFVTIYHKKY